jgi:23S rRNA G2069 N7-methylase RlmK/C1962 C5-methylase RlmI
VLNLFAYTCSLSVAAAKGGARQVDSVDLSNTYLEWGRINFAINGFEALHSGALSGDSLLSLIRSDVIRFVKEAAERRLRWDIIILDPPGFSNSKKMRGTLDIRRDCGELIRLCFPLLSRDGELWFSSSARGLSLENGDFAGFTVEDLRTALVDEDFKGKRIPACYILKRDPDERRQAPSRPSSSV